MQVKINGEIRDIAPGKTLQGLLADLKVRAGTVVTELNGEIIKEDRYVSKTIPENAEIEIVRFVGGG